jgi:hypothetical protein
VTVMLLIGIAKLSKGCSLAMDRAARGEFGELGPDDFVLQPLMVSLGVIMRIELRKGAPQRRLPNRDHWVQAATLDGTYIVFRESIQVWTSRRKSQWLYPGAFENLGTAW